MQLVEPRPNRPIPIRITPLIDVVFILLVFFMLTTRLSDVNYLELSNNTKGQSTSQNKVLTEIRVNADGTINWLNNNYTLVNILPLLANKHISEVNISTLPETNLTYFTQTLSMLDNAGITAYWQHTKATER